MLKSKSSRNRAEPCQNRVVMCRAVPAKSQAIWSSGGCLGKKIAELAYEFDDGRFSDMFPGLCQIMGDGNQLFLKSWTGPRNV